MYSGQIVVSDEAYHVQIFRDGRHVSTIDAYWAHEADTLLFVLTQTQNPEALLNVKIPTPE
jgi:hypothetical protein